MRAKAVTAMHDLPPDLIVCERDWLSSNNLICLGDAPAIIDTGHVKNAAETLALVRQHLGDQPLASVAHTHLHSDHCGGSGTLQRAYPGAQTWVPEPSLAHVQSWDEDQLTFGDTVQRCDRFNAQHALVPGARVRLGQHDWELHPAPGHDTLAVLLFQPEHGVLMAGDAMWEHGVGVIFPYIDGSAGFEPFLDTLDLVERLAPQVVVPGHGAPFSRQGGALDAALARARARIQQFQDNPAQHALYAAKVLIKYQMMDVEQMPAPAFDAWLHSAPSLHKLHQQHRPDMAWADWLNTVILGPMFDKGQLRRTDAAVLNGV